MKAPSLSDAEAMEDITEAVLKGKSTWMPILEVFLHGLHVIHRGEHHWYRWDVVKKVR